MTLQLRWYQQAAVNSLFDYFNKNTGNPIIALPTGTGKSVVWAQFAYTASYYYPGTRILMLTHRKELIEQNEAKLLRLWPTAPVGVYSAGVGRKDRHSKILCAGIQSIAPVIDTFDPFNLAVIDEAHLVPQHEKTQYRKVLDKMYTANPALKVIGMTATPYRTGMGDLTEGGIFTDYCYDMTGKDAFNRLIAEGYLCRLVPRQTQLELDTEGVAVRAGDYVEKELQQALDKESITRAAVEEAIGLAGSRKRWLVFATGVQHAEHITDMLKAKGITAYTVAGKTAKEERERILAEFSDESVHVPMAIVNNNVLTTGFDCPMIDLIVMLRPTQSASLWVQMLGRGTRPFPGKEDCMVLDFARNTRRLGPINDPVLPHKKKDKAGGDAPVKVCPACGAYNSTRAAICSECGAVFPPPECKLKATAGTDALIASSAPDLPEIARFKVDTVAYTAHRKQGKPPSLRVSYLCGLREFSEYIHFELAGLPRHNAVLWWNRRSVATVPATTEEALIAAKFIPKPQFINVQMNSKYQKVVSCEF